MATITLLISILLFAMLFTAQIFMMRKKSMFIRQLSYGFDVLFLFVFIRGAVNPAVAGVGMLISCVAMVVMITAGMFAS